METAGISSFWLTRFCFQRALGFIYLIAFLIIINQILPLIGDRGLLPARFFVAKVRFWDAPSLFWFQCSDRMLLIIGWSGLVLSVLAMTGLSERFGIFFSAFVWFCLWLFYLSFVNAGQVFYGFGWETILLETGFLAIFLGSSDVEPPKIVIWLLRWVLFRIMFGAGLIKLRGDSCWRDLTCMFYHYETQPLPNPLSWYFHKLPPLVHKGEVLLTHAIELIAPWAYFFPGWMGYLSGGVTILFQILLILSGNLSWLNFITIVVSIACFDDRLLSKIIPLQIPAAVPLEGFRQGVIYLLLAAVLLLSIRPIANLISSRQIMNTSFDPLHLVNTYGAFGSVTRQRMEIVIEGTADEVAGDLSDWREYEFKGKPGDPARAPCIVSPYHWKLDWQMWFAAMSDYRFHPWLLNLVAKLLQGDKRALSLMGQNPFPEAPPRYIRARLYEYHFTTSEEKKRTGHWWKRTFSGQYLPPLSLREPRFKELLRDQGWL